MKNIFKNKSGMTLMELLISISIIAIMSSLYIANIRSYDRSSDLLNAAHELASNIRLMQNYALGLKKYNPGTGPEMPAGGWGIRMGNSDSNNENKEYRLFADRDSSEKYRASEDSVPADRELFKIVKFPPDIKVREFDVDGYNRRFFYLIYIPPDPQILIKIANNESNDNHYRDSDVFNQAIITLERVSDNTQSIDIVVNRYGLIDIN